MSIIVSLTSNLTFNVQSESTRFCTTEPKECETKSYTSSQTRSRTPVLYILSPHDLPSSSRTPLVPLIDPRRAISHRVNTRKYHHNRSATTSSGQAEARSYNKLYQEYCIEASRTAAVDVTWVFAPALPNAEVPVADGGLWGAGAQGWARSGAGTDADAVGKVGSAKLGTRRRFKDLGTPGILRSKDGLDRRVLAIRA